MGSKYLPKQGVYRLKNPGKYTGPLTDGGVLYRSSWESRMFYYMDNNANVIEWSSEGLIIPYIFKLDGKVHKYYPDIVCTIKKSDGSLQTYVIEIKPYKQTIPPTKPKNRSLDRKRKFEKELYTYAKNTNKWEYAKEYCDKNGYIFKLLTEKEIYMS